MLKKNFQKSGFTLIELLVVVAIIAILSSIVLSSINATRSKTRDTKRISDFKQFQTALGLFYSSYNRYPVTGGGPTWDDHWQIFATCLQTGVGCGFAISNYVPVISKVSQDPLDAPGSSDSDPTYYAGWEGVTDQNYILRVFLENANSPVLQNDADGGWRSAGDGLCNDPWYCIKQNFPW